MRVTRHALTPNRQRGFTLIEVIVALGILTFVLGTTLSLVMSTLGIHRQGSERLQRHEQVVSLFNRLENDLRGLQTSGREGFVHRQEVSQGGLFGSDTTRQWLEYRTLAPVDRRLLADENAQPLLGATTVQLGEIDPSAGHVILRSSLSGGETSDRPFKALSRVTFRFWRNGEWSTSWSRPELPDLVEVTIAANGRSGGMRSETYRRVIALTGSAL